MHTSTQVAAISKASSKNLILYIWHLVPKLRFGSGFDLEMLLPKPLILCFPFRTEWNELFLSGQ